MRSTASATYLVNALATLSVFEPVSAFEVVWTDTAAKNHAYELHVISKRYSALSG
jgi:hypothetical protein